MYKITDGEGNNIAADLSAERGICHERRGRGEQEVSKRVNKSKTVLICMLSVFVLFSSMYTVSADDVDDLLSKCGIAPDPKPSVMVYNYELNPKTLMPGDVGVLTITLKNMQDKPIEKEIDIKEEFVTNSTIEEEITKEIERTSDGLVGEHTIKEKVEPKTRTIDIDTQTRFTMDAYIKEAYIVEQEFEIGNKYVSAGVIGPNEKVDLAFKIKAPAEEGIFMLKFLADIEDTEGKTSKGIRYFIPVAVSGTLNILPLEVSQNEVRLEVINEGLNDVNCVYVAVSNTTMVEVLPERMYVGNIKSGESVIAVFKVNKTEGVEDTVIFKAVYKNGVNKHESNPVCVRVPFEKGQSFGTLITSPADSFSSTLGSKLPWSWVVLAFAGLLVVALTYLHFVWRKGKIKNHIKRFLVLSNYTHLLNRTLNTHKKVKNLCGRRENKR